jgi:hypothetical protein
MSFTVRGIAGLQCLFGRVSGLTQGLTSGPSMQNSGKLKCWLMTLNSFFLWRYGGFGVIETWLLTEMGTRGTSGC